MDLTRTAYGTWSGGRYMHFGEPLSEERFIAENVASHCRGVTRVENKLTVDPLEEISDEATVRAVRCALAYCEDFETDGISISCADGHLELRGEVPTMMDLTLAEELARMQGGVCSVANHIQVRATIAAAVPAVSVRFCSSTLLGWALCVNGLGVSSAAETSTRS